MGRDKSLSERSFSVENTNTSPTGVLGVDVEGRPVREETRLRSVEGFEGRGL